MNKLFRENGFLSEEGGQAVQLVQAALDSLLASYKVSEMSDSEIQTLGGNLAKMVGDAVSNKLQARKDLTKLFDEMTDEQFEAYMKAKYGVRWGLVTITKEEFARLRPISDAEIKDAWEEGLKAREAALSATTQVHDSGLRFKS